MSEKSTKSKPKDPVDALNFEIALKDLETMIEKIAGGQLTLEESLKNFEQGIALARRCQTALKDAEQKVQILISQNGGFETRDFFKEA
ncbi:MAG TPA: exodeoxyribonuclease VII small subunit [Gammaproteobacteria bacterium]|nr:exodeoxyribonuclease VII small subunit [Gammaproteobacteria bacterium]